MCRMTSLGACAAPRSAGTLDTPATAKSVNRKSRRAGKDAITVDLVRTMARVLPEATEAPHFDMLSFRVGGKIFATMPKDGLHLHIFVDEAEREPLVATYPDVFEKLWWGKKVVGLRVNLLHAEVAAVATLLKSAWSRKAPKRLLVNA